MKRKLRREAGMSMPLHQVSAVPPQDAASARVSRSKAKEREREEQVWRECRLQLRIFVLLIKTV